MQDRLQIRKLWLRFRGLPSVIIALVRCAGILSLASSLEVLPGGPRGILPGPTEALAGHSERGGH